MYVCSPPPTVPPRHHPPRVHGPHFLRESNPTVPPPCLPTVRCWSSPLLSRPPALFSQRTQPRPRTLNWCTNTGDDEAPACADPGTRPVGAASRNLIMFSLRNRRMNRYPAFIECAWAFKVHLADSFQVLASFARAMSFQSLVRDARVACLPLGGCLPLTNPSLTHMLDLYLL